MKNKISLPLTLALMGFIGIHSVAHAEMKYKTNFIAKTDFQSVDWNGGKASLPYTVEKSTDGIHFYAINEKSAGGKKFFLRSRFLTAAEIFFSL